MQAILDRDRRRHPKTQHCSLGSSKAARLPSQPAEAHEQPAVRIGRRAARRRERRLRRDQAARPGGPFANFPLTGGREGYTDHAKRVIATDTRLDPAARLVVLLHEAAHALLHGDLAPGEFQAHRGVCETEAESTAYVLANLLGLDVDASSISYVAGWSSADPAVLTAAAANVLCAVNTIAAGLGLDDDQDDAGCVWSWWSPLSRR
jgi:hypothetical protein